MCVRPSGIGHHCFSQECICISRISAQSQSLPWKQAFSDFQVAGFIWFARSDQRLSTTWAYLPAKARTILVYFCGVSLIWSGSLSVRIGFLSFTDLLKFHLVTLSNYLSNLLKKRLERKHFQYWRMLIYESESDSVMSDSLSPHGLQPTSLLCPRGFSRQELEWVAIPISRGPSQPRDWTWVSCIAGRFFTVWATREANI